MVTRSELLLTLTAPLSHHDPASTDKSNTLLFNRAKQLYPRAVDVIPSTQTEIDAIVARFPVPGDMHDIFDDVGYYEFLGVALIKTFLDMYNRGDGSGIFTGMERYTRLETRTRMAAVHAQSLRQWWNHLTTHLQVQIHGGDDDMALFALLSVSRSAQEGVLSALAHDHRSIISLARLWHDLSKKQSESYAKKAGAETAEPSVPLQFAAASSTVATGIICDIDVPAVQGNSIRHQVVRAPGWVHLTNYLGIRSAFPGDGALPAGVEAIFENGGNMAGGAKQPSGPHGHAWAIRRMFPLLDLLGGCTDSFDLGESRLKPSVWLVCRENRAALGGLQSPNIDVSAYTMLDEVTQTRMASRAGEGQMIYNCEALVKGSQFLVRFTLDAFTPDLTKGAFAAALDTYLNNAPRLGGQARAGFGSVTGTWLKQMEGAADLQQGYETYLNENRETLIESMLNGKLGTTAQVVS